MQIENSDLTPGNLFIYKDRIPVIRFKLLILLFLSKTGWDSIRDRRQDSVSFARLHL